MELDDVELLVPWDVLVVELVRVDDHVAPEHLLGEEVDDIDFVDNEERLEDEVLLGLLLPFGEGLAVDEDDLETVVLDERLEVEEPDEDLELAEVTDEMELAEDVRVVDEEDVPLLVADDVLDTVEEPVPVLLTVNDEL